MSANPEASKVAGTDETIVLRDDFVAHGRTVPIEHGWTWIATAWSIFRRAFGIWIGMVVTLAIIYTVLAVLPVIGAIASFVLGPVFTAGLVLTSRTIDQGGEVQFSQLFGGFKYRFGTLLVVGVLYLAGTAAIVFLVVALTGVSLIGLLNATSPEAAMALGATVLVALLLILALMLPLIMAIWFAPPLVVFHELGALEAMKASFVGCLRNMLPFLLYGVVLLVAAIVASIPFMLGWLLLGPVMAASIYTAYRDIYFTT
jgi:uncharacterized membrane protein